MLVYILAAAIAALLQIGIIYFLRINFWESFLYAAPLILAYQFLFLWSYAKSPKFIIIWFITTALTNSLAFLVGYFLWHEQISAWNIAGIIMIFAGIIFLQIK
jgi:drug/metabolite transporter (DMT)-like permease